MAITTALLEFLVIGALWMLAVASLSLVLGFLPIPTPATPETSSSASLALLAIPFTYFIGVIAQAATWKYWYLPRYHLPALTKLLDGPQRPTYDRLLEAVRRRLPPGLGPSFCRLNTGQELGHLLDLLRIEMLRPDRLELTRQYQMQFHLYRLSYGGIPPMVFLGCIFLAGVIVELLCRGHEKYLLYLLLSAAGWASAILAGTAAAHRRQRLWKYLTLGACLFLGDSESPARSLTDERGESDGD